MRKVNGLIGIVISIIVLVCGVSLSAQAESAGSRPRVVVQPKVMVRGSQVTLGDIAQVSATAQEHDELVLRLRQIPLVESPAPLTKTTIMGPKVLEAIEALGVSRDTIGYSIPNVIEVERAGRTVQSAEILEATRRTIGEHKELDVQVRDVVWEGNQVVPIGEAQFLVEALGAPSTGRIPLRVEANVDGQTEARFLATALVDDWRAVPVVSKNISRGMLINPEDVQVVRLNMLKQPADVLEKLEQVIGKRALSSIGAGETVRRTMVDIPPLIPRGKRIALTYQNGSLTATALGIALEDGIEQSMIKVKNENSGKIVRGKVVGPDQVSIAEQLPMLVP